MLKEAAVVVPLLFLFTFVHNQRLAFSVLWLTAVLRILSGQCKVQTFERHRALGRQLFTDALFFFEPFDFMTARTTVLLDLSLPFLSEFGIVHERNISRSRRG